MSDTASPIAIGIFVALFFLISSLGFVATRWKKADLNQLDEWGLGGRRFGPLLRLELTLSSHAFHGAPEHDSRARRALGGGFAEVR